MMDQEQLGQLPEDLRALHEELSAIRYEERPSFGPELRAELARTWEEEGLGRRRSSLPRHLAAAAVVLFLVGTAAVPSARASFVRLLGSMRPPEPEAVTAAPAPATAAAAGSIAIPAEETASPPLEVEEVPSPPAEVAVEAVPDPVMVAPEMVDRVQAEELLQSVYPVALQRRGVGGTVWLRLWVDERGVPGDVSVARSSGLAELDRAAVEAAPDFQFTPALQDGRATGTWIEFPVLFEPEEVLPDLSERDDRALRPLVDPLSLPTIAREDWWQLREPLDLVALPAPTEISRGDADARASAAEELAGVLAGSDVLDRYGPAASILTGEAPRSVTPTEWRAAVGEALSEAIDGGAESPAALLAFGRIRIRQGLRPEARGLFERGLQIAIREPDSANPWLVAELHHERASLVRDRWLGGEGVGRVRAEAFATVSCTPARTFGGSENGFASVDRLIAWNYLCPGEMAAVFGRGFEPTGIGSGADLSLMMASTHAAIEAYPAHVGANTSLLVTLAMEERWEDVLAGARRFARVTGGHPDALLLAGMALHRTGRTDDAIQHFRAALERMPEMVGAELRDLRPLLTAAEAAEYDRLPLGERRAWEDAYWDARGGDARWVEHLTRMAFARLRFGSPFGDAGEVWVRFGRPDGIHIVDDGSGRLTEFWDYGSGPDITFVRWVSSKRTDLTPEGRAYVDDLGKIFPPQ